MTIVSIPTEDREWYEQDTISVDKNGTNGDITQVGIGAFNSITIIVDSTGIIGTTTVV
ncbi:MAG: hypothetical protein J4F36_11575 [Nitrosopumilaceae archaeon]|nr:hypothetical protein [Nitrosopumilaceae archaeon]